MSGATQIPIPISKRLEITYEATVPVSPYSSQSVLHKGLTAYFLAPKTPIIISGNQAKIAIPLLHKELGHFSVVLFPQNALFSKLSYCATANCGTLTFSAFVWRADKIGPISINDKANPFFRNSMPYKIVQAIPKISPSLSDQIKSSPGNYNLPPARPDFRKGQDTKLKNPFILLKRTRFMLPILKSFAIRAHLWLDLSRASQFLNCETCPLLTYFRQEINQMGINL